MKGFAVLGLGRFGMALAEELSRLGQRVTAVDADPERTREAQAFVQQALVADATRRHSLASMGLGEAEGAVVSLGESMDRASLAVLHLDELAVPRIVAKALNEEHAAMLARIGATHVVFPEKEMAFRVAERLGSQHVLSYVPMGAGFAVLEMAAPRAWLGRGLEELDLGRTFGVQVLAVRELVPERTVVAPPPGQIFKDSDVLVVFGPDEAIDRVRRLGVQRRRFAVIGLGRFGYHLVRSLYGLGHDVLAVDDREETVEQIAPSCSQAIRADATDPAQLRDAGVEEAHVGIVAMGTRLDASILATLYLKEAGVREIVAKASSAPHARILERIGAGDVVRPERDSALLTAQRLAEPAVLERLPFLEGYAFTELPAPPALWGRSLGQSHLRREHQLSVVLVERRVGGEVVTLPASPDEVLREGDQLTVLARPADVAAFRREHPP